MKQFDSIGAISLLVVINAGIWARMVFNGTPARRAAIFSISLTLCYGFIVISHVFELPVHDHVHNGLIILWIACFAVFELDLHRLIKKK